MSDTIQREPKQLAEHIRHLVVESTSYADFGESFVRNALLEAANAIESGKVKDNAVEIAVRVNVRVGFQGPPVTQPVFDPYRLDLQYEVCASGEGTGGFWACFAQSGPRAPTPHPRG
jgi:hypothetical protein